jgi:hypothetical protein
MSIGQECGQLLFAAAAWVAGLAAEVACNGGLRGPTRQSSIKGFCQKTVLLSVTRRPDSELAGDHHGCNRRLKRVSNSIARSVPDG